MHIFVCSITTTKINMSATKTKVSAPKTEMSAPKPPFAPWMLTFILCPNTATYFYVRPLHWGGNKRSKTYINYT